MIESRYWKEELRRIAQSIRHVQKPERWTERAHCIVERDLIIGFFILRRLIELHKVSSATTGRLLKVSSYRAQGKSITRLNAHNLFDSYDLEKEASEIKKPLYMANQFIHAYTSLVVRDEKRNWADVFVVSDYERNNCIWRVPVSEIRGLFLTAADDYPHTIRMEFAPARKDYEVKTN